ncbi:MAG TPA: hypothetical protein VF011_20190 [Terriglobales bacterium]
MIRGTLKAVLPVLVALLLLAPLFAQARQSQESRRPAATAEASPQGAGAPSYEFFSILDGMPMLLALHHDTEVGTNNPIDVYMLVIEMQVMNSDGNLEPVGLQIHNYYTARPVHPHDDFNPHNARDCKYWNALVTEAMLTRPPTSKTWPYIEFTVAEGARIIQTNEDGAVWWSDDIQCWGSDDRFPPF